MLPAVEHALSSLSMKLLRVVDALMRRDRARARAFGPVFLEYRASCLCVSLRDCPDASAKITAALVLRLSVQSAAAAAVVRGKRQQVSETSL